MKHLIWSAVILVILIGTIGCTSAKEESAKQTTPELPLKIPFEKKSSQLPVEPENIESAVSAIGELDGIPAELKQQCAVAICGEPSQVVAPWPWSWQPQALSEQERVWLDKDLWSRARMILDLQEENAKRSIDQFDASVSRLRKVQMNASHLAYANAIWFSAHLREAMRGLRPNASGNGWMIDHAALALALPKMSTQDRQYMKAFLADFVSSWEWGLMTSVQRSGLADTLVMIAPGQNAAELMQEMGKTLSQQIGSLQNRFGEMEIPTPRSVVALREGRDLTPELEQDLLFSFILAYEARVVAEENLFASRPAPELNSLIDGYADNVLGKLKEQLANPKQLDEQRTQIWNSCSMTLASAWQKSPTRKEVQSAKIWLEEVKGQALQEGLVFVNSSDEQQRLKQQVSQILFNLPLAKEDLIEPMKRGLNIELQRLLRQQQNGIIASDMDLLLKIYADSTMEVQSVFETPSVCSLFVPETLSDHALTGFGKVSLSWPTIKFPQFGKGVAAHEVGHMISAELRSIPGEKQALRAMHTCIANRHGQAPESQRWQYSEEDFADEIALRVMKKANAAGNGLQNKGCLLMGHNGQKWGGRELSLKWAAGMNSRHSTDFFRAVSIQIHSGKGLPQVCQGLVNQYAPELQASCE